MRAASVTDTVRRSTWSTSVTSEDLGGDWSVQRAYVLMAPKRAETIGTCVVLAARYGSRR